MVACGDAMRLRFRNKHQKIGLLFKELATMETRQQMKLNTTV